MENGRNVNLHMMWRIMREDRRVIGSIIVGCLLVAFLFACMLPKQYASTVVVQTRNAGHLDANTMAALGLSKEAISMSTMNYLERMKTRAVVSPVIDSLDWKNQEKPKVAEFIKKNLSIQNKIGTNLIVITGKARTPEDAQKIAQGVVDSFAHLQEKSNQETVNVLDELFKKYLDETRKDAEEATRNLTIYLQNHKTSSDESLQPFIDRLVVYDSAIATQRVEKKTAETRQDVAMQSIEKNGIELHSFDINNDSVVQELFEKIVNETLDLVVLQQRYAETNSEVVKRKSLVNNLKGELSNRIDKIVADEYKGMKWEVIKSISSKQKAETEAELADKCENALKVKQDWEIMQIARSSEMAATVLQLDSEVKVRQEVYSELYRCYQQDKAQIALGNMDIQIVDPADLPDKPSGPNIKTIMSIGLYMGILFSMLYECLKYKKIWKKGI